MRVLFYRINSGFNGVTTWMDDLGTGLKQRGVDVSYWFGSASPERAALFERIGPTRVGSVAALLGVLGRERYDIIQVHTGDRKAIALTLLDLGSRLVASNHGSVSHLWNSSNCHALTAVSADVAALEQPYTDLAVDLIRNAVSLGRFAPPTELGSGPPIVAWVGRADDARLKNYARFTRIAALLADRGFRLWVADGSGKSPGDFVGEGFAPVRFERWGRVPLAEMPALYRAVAASGGVILMSSRYEALPLVPLEAAACGAATIGPEVLGVREAIRPEWGATFPATTSDADAAAFVTDWIGAHPPSLARWDARADALAQQFPMARMVDQYLEVYQRSTPNLAKVRATLPEPLPSGARECIAEAPTPKQRHQSVWQPLARDLVEAGENRLAMRSVGRALRHDPGVVTRPRSALNLMGTVARVVGLRRSRSR